MKKYLCLICLLLCFVFTGCSSVSYTYEESLTGEVSDNIYFPITVSSFEALGLSQSDYETVVQNALNEWNSYTFSERTSWVRYINSNELLSDAEKTYYLNGIAFDADTTSVNGITFSINFISSYVRNLYYTYDQPESDEEDDGAKIEEGSNAFIYHVVTETQTFFASTTTDSSGQQINIVDYLYNKANEWISGSGVQLPRPELVFNYATLDSRLHSDADSVTRIGSTYVHSWTLEGTDAQKVVHFYYTEANRWPWYVLAFGISLAVMAGIFIYAKVKDR